MKNISIIFLSIFLESLPFILLGSLISSVIEVFISNDKIAKIIPKNKVLGSIVGVLLGFFIPACDCAVIPVSKRLLKKKVPINVAVSFMLASPIINPVVLLSTYTAFYKTSPEIFWYRLIFGIIISLIIGIIIGIIYKDKDITLNNSDEECCHHTHNHNKLIKIINHTILDMYDVLKYLMLGAFITVIFQTIIPRGIITVFNNNQILSIITLMIFAYLISLCSTSDSFVGKSLMSQFTNSSVLAYLLLGPMIDIKNTLVLLGNYNKKFVYTLISLIFIIIFLFSIGVILI